MKTIKQIADEIGVSKQAMYKKIKQEPLSTRLTGTIQINQHITTIISQPSLQAVSTELTKLTMRLTLKPTK